MKNPIKIKVGAQLDDTIIIILTLYYIIYIIYINYM